MDTVRGTKTRLRRTFQFPEEDSTDSQPEALDEQEQEALIATLAAENESRNAQFRLILLALPLLAAVPYVPSLFRRSTVLLALLSLSSLFSTAYLVYHHPPTVSGFALLDAWARPKTPHPTRTPSVFGGDDDDDDDIEEDADDHDDGAVAGSSFAAATARRRERGRRSSFSFQPRASPLETYLPYLNLGLGIVLVLLGFVAARSGNAAVWTGMGYLPMLVYAAVLASKLVMASVDPEKELAALRYEYKGA